ncbi:hypothetical protein BXZ70DRAFT_386131 [Cristinia sonorae]|uniref:Uncharacterized protein n=1 Tax=Cristinia sonorae TaxID=1940300 RepID=A0A8K0XMD6_9AGAR|nr:hypothetical protein BXZ70DRAFT_386131 [Cristinia sonorae]
MERTSTHRKVPKSPRKQKTRTVTERRLSLDSKRKCKIKLTMVDRNSRHIVRSLKYSSTNSDNCTMEGIVQQFFAPGGKNPEINDWDSGSNSEYLPAPSDASSQRSPSESDTYHDGTTSYGYEMGEEAFWGRSSTANDRNSMKPAEGHQDRAQDQSPGGRYALLNNHVMQQPADSQYQPQPPGMPYYPNTTGPSAVASTSHNYAYHILQPGFALTNFPTPNSPPEESMSMVNEDTTDANSELSFLSGPE